MVGYLARSLMGHDKGKVYVIVSDLGRDVLLSDGESDRKKKKNKKHIQVIKVRNTKESVKECIASYNNRRSVDV